MARSRRNRKNKRLDGSSFPVPFAGVVVLLSVLGLSYVWLVGQCDALGKELKVLEKEQARLHKKYLNEEFRWTRMKSPRNMERVLRIRKIPMDWPRGDQIVVLHRSDPFKGNTLASTSVDSRRYPGTRMDE